MRAKLAFLFACLFLYSFCYSQKITQVFRVTPRVAENQHIDLSGTWELSYTDTPVASVLDLQDRKNPFETQVPSSVQWSFFNAGKLPHPYVSLNMENYKWILEKCWYYRKEVEIPLSSQGKKVILCFDGIDYFSKVWINDQLVGEHEGMFGGPAIDIGKFVRFGEKNRITVEVRAANWANKNYNSRASGKIIKPWITAGGSGKAALFSIGIWQGARIEILPEVHMERPFLTTKHITDDQALLHLSLEILAGQTSLDKKLHPWNNAQIHHPSARGTSFINENEKLAVLVEFLLGEQLVLSKTFEPTVYSGTNWLEQDIALANPKLWYPNGLGEPNLYQVRLTLKKDQVVTDRLSFEFGIRTVERVASAGPRTADRWENWQFMINGEKLFVKGMNWTPADVLLDLPKERYEWVLDAARNMGIQLIRVWGGGLIETDDFYALCNRLGIMVWQDFPIGNQDTPDFPQDVWESQVVQNIFRLRNHPSLVAWCGGNEFNPYSTGNTASIGIIERNLDIFDKTRFFVRTTPDDGSMHTYPDMDPCWYNRSYRFEPWVSETGIHSMPEANLFYELVSQKEFIGLGKMWDKDFPGNHPEFTLHFDEYSPSRVPRMLSRASHIDDMADPTIESITEASQIGAGEWYQIVSEKMQGNYPITTGLMPWVFKRHWPAIAIQMLDWFGQAAAPYYFLKRTYEPTHVALDLQRLIWAADERIGLKNKITHAGNTDLSGTVWVTVFNDAFQQLWEKKEDVRMSKGPSVTQTNFGEYQIPVDYKDRYLFIVTELKDGSGKLISRSVYCPRVLRKMDDKEFYNKYVNEPIPWITLDKGPWLKPTVARTRTKLDATLLGNEIISGNTNRLQVKVKNAGKIPAFMTKIDIEGAKRIFYASDNYFWLAPREEKTIDLTVQFRESFRSEIVVKTYAWNAKPGLLKLNPENR